MICYMIKCGEVFHPRNSHPKVYTKIGNAKSAISHNNMKGAKIQLYEMNLIEEVSYGE